MNPTTDFSQNWNGKLSCDVFGTIRRHNPGKYEVGVLHTITLKKVFFKEARIVKIVELAYWMINDVVAMLDTGYFEEDFRKIFGKMYPDIKDNSVLDWIFFKTEK